MREKLEIRADEFEYVFEISHRTAVGTISAGSEKRLVFCACEKHKREKYPLSVTDNWALSLFFIFF